MVLFRIEAVLTLLKFTGKERDTLTGLDYFGARYYGSSYGRFESPDPKSAGADRQNPQSWNGYNYALNNPLAFVDPNGKWPFYVHNRIHEAALGGLLSRSQLKLLNRVSWDADFGSGNQVPARSYTHAMCFPGQSGGACAAMIGGFVYERLSSANRLSMGGANITAAALSAFGEAVHALIDMGDPAHFREEALAWGNGSSESVMHYLGESSESVNWAGVGQSIRMTISAGLVALPELVKRQGDPQAWMNRTITDYVQRHFVHRSRTCGMMNNEGNYSGYAEEEEARQCALGNPAACRR
ncbi:MAG: RHS repeat-associated core domain-containing protein [Acidobacteriales bacterium]|nr:RHS repeat-associated core domain-containing protein [Terriglobales bacterium]